MSQLAFAFAKVVIPEGFVAAVALNAWAHSALAAVEVELGSSWAGLVTVQKLAFAFASLWVRLMVWVLADDVWAWLATNVRPDVKVPGAAVVL